MSEESDDNFVLRDWVRKQIEAGDDPEVLKTVLKNRGMDPDIVKRVLSLVKNNPLAKKAEVPVAKPKKIFTNNALKSEVEKIFSDNLSVIASSNMNRLNEAKLAEISERNSAADAVDGGVSHKKAVKKNVNKYVLKKKPVKNAVTAEMDESQLKEPREAAEIESGGSFKEESIFSLFVAQVRGYFSRIKIGSPKLTDYIFDTRIVIFTGIAVAVLIIALLASFGLNWYADRMAQSVLK